MKEQMIGKIRVWHWNTSARVCIALIRVLSFVYRKRLWALVRGCATIVNEGIPRNIREVSIIFMGGARGGGAGRGAANIGLKAYVICRFLEIRVANIFRMFFIHEDISPEKACTSDIKEVMFASL